MSSPIEAPSSFGDALRAWRQQRGMSQLDLALAAGASPRHLSFLETNRAKPSRDMVLTLADAMVIPRASRNALLNAAGYAPLYPSTPLDAESLGPLRAVLSEMMARHAPNPAMLCDRYWTLHDANETARALLAPLHGPSGEMNMVRMLTQSAVAPELIANFGEVLEEMIGRIRLEALEAGGDPEFAALLKLLEDAARRHPPPKPAQPRRPLVPLVLMTPAGELRFLSAITHFGTNEDAAVRDLRLELLFPVDDATRDAMRALAP
ncbi:MAG: helix-turn-helix transcriptional regulator [Hyphomonadaceae bacterium]|nr:helix-turn-helix transcriptional regulator [Hyphomonadaceae bacterium]